MAQHLATDLRFPGVGAGGLVPPDRLVAGRTDLEDFPGVSGERARRRASGEPDLGFPSFGTAADDENDGCGQEMTTTHDAPFRSFP